MRVAGLFYRCLLLLTALISMPAGAEPGTGFRLENFDYPYPVQMMTLASQQQTLEMAYMDVKPAATNGKTVVLFHGKNFCAATWGGIIKSLTAAGYRVIAIDQIGFCKSSKPLDYQYSFHQLAANSRQLLDRLGIENSYVMGHSMGGMLATRYALLYPEKVSGLLMVNPIGLEDWLGKGVPYIRIDDWYQNQLQMNAGGIRQYQQQTYYAGQWRDDYDIWVEMLAGQFEADRESSARLSALIYDMILSQPVVHEFDRLKVPAWLFIGARDTTAIGKAFVSDKIRQKLGRYDLLGTETVAVIPDARLHLFPELGHSPHIQSPDRFNQALINALERMR